MKRFLVFSFTICLLAVAGGFTAESPSREAVGISNAVAVDAESEGENLLLLRSKVQAEARTCHEPKKSRFAVGQTSVCLSPEGRTTPAGAGPLAFLPLLFGLVINAANLKEVYLNLSTIFQNAFDTAETTWQKIAMLVPSSGSETSYKWMGAFPAMRKWVGDKFVKALEGMSYTIVNDDFEATVAVDRNDIEDDNYGVYRPMAEMAGESARQLPDTIVAELLNKAFVSKCYDGQYFVDTDHPVNGVSVSNKGTKKLSTATQAKADGSYGAARLALMTMKDSEGKPLAINPNILVVPPALETTATKLMNSDKLDDNTLNPYKGQAEVVVFPLLTDPNAWFLMDGSKRVKPLVYQERKAAVFVEQTSMASETVFSRKEFKFGAEARAAGGYAFWQFLFGSDGTIA